MEMFDLKASIAREMADNPAVILKRINKIINEKAKEGGVRITYCFDSISQKALLEIIKTLNCFGYGTSVRGFDDDGDPIVIDAVCCDLKDCELVISW